ncbi:MAG: tRNA uridine-5-carboxymethylaminomethyl(34) synthesis GTPase MnmE [Lachnospiraceae bacterium]|jgi:tRNA modification GTPase|nr:tRNA uridine-5-carboxymethylaminomethyl(34) synthesis GTPase MnmE [Lachnospiraceae bacterium]
MKSDTIFAPATATGSAAGIGIIRISGERAISITTNIFPALTQMKSHTICYGFLVDGEEVLDEVMVSLMKAPRSYTCEDIVEINCHGGIRVIKRIMLALIKYGARLAEPGEFTKRAFLNGRIDLSQATAVCDIITAENDIALRSGLRQLAGSVRETIKSIRAEIMHEVSFIEAVLDDPDGYPDTAVREVGIIAIIDQVSQLLQMAKQGKILKDGINTVIIGKPNVGKSSLFNRLLSEERAIVTDIAGTTRDALHEMVLLGEVMLKIVDTAGIRDSDDPIEAKGVERTIGHIEAADLVIFMLDSSLPIDDDDRRIAALLADKRVIIMMNKSDLRGDGLLRYARNDESGIVDKTFPHVDEIGKLLVENNVDKQAIIHASMKNGEGIKELEEMITKMFINSDINEQEAVYITNVRHIEAMDAAHASMENVRRGLSERVPEDLLTIDMMDAYTSLGKIIGEAVEDDLIEEIFANFCLGK